MFNLKITIINNMAYLISIFISLSLKCINEYLILSAPHVEKGYYISKILGAIILWIESRYLS